MKLVCLIKDASPYAPAISIASKAGHRRVFVWNQEQKAHVWDRGFIGENDSADLEDLLGSRDEFYRPLVRILKGELVHRHASHEEAESVEEFMTAEKVCSRDPLNFKDKNKNRVDDRLEGKKR